MSLRPLCLASLALLALPAHATIQVTTSSGARNVSGACALRDALVAIATLAPAGGCPAGAATDTIELPAGVTITLSARDPDSVNAGLPSLVSRNVTIEGNGATIARSGGAFCIRNGTVAEGEFRLFETRNGSLVLRNVTLRNGCADGAALAAYGGAVYSELSRLELHRVRVEDSGAWKGGGVYHFARNSAPARIVESTFFGNAAGAGGAVYYDNDVDGTSMRIDRSVFHGNLLSGVGNVTPYGSALVTQGSTVVYNSTFTGNLDLTSGNGTIVVLKPSHPTEIGYLTLISSTVANNGPLGIWLPLGEQGGVYLTNSIVSGHTSTDYNVYYEDQRLFAGKNFFSDDSGCSPRTEADGTAVCSANPQLQPLADNGGPTLTRAFAVTSPALDVDPTCMFLNPRVDQRGIARPIGGACDAGAFEFADDVFRNGFE